MELKYSVVALNINKQKLHIVKATSIGLQSKITYRKSDINGFAIAWNHPNAGGVGKNFVLRLVQTSPSQTLAAENLYPSPTVVYVYECALAKNPRCHEHLTLIEIW